MVEGVVKVVEVGEGGGGGGHGLGWGPWGASEGEVRYADAYGLPRDVKQSGLGMTATSIRLLVFVFRMRCGVLWLASSPF